MEVPFPPPLVLCRYPIRAGMSISMPLDSLAKRFCRDAGGLQRVLEQLKLVRFSTLARKVELAVQAYLFQQRG